MRLPRSRRLGVYLVVLLCIGLSISAGGAVALPGNGLIAFVRDGDVWVVEPDGSDAVNLTLRRVVFPQVVAWSPDGAWLAVQGFTGTTTTTSVMRADGSEFADVTTGTANVSLGCWLSPDRLVVRDQRQGADGAGDSDLFIVQPDGTEVDRLTTDGGLKFLSTSSCASATGTVFYLRQEGEGQIPYRVGTAGGAPMRLVLDGVRLRQPPTPSPDGSRIALLDQNGIAVAGADGSGLTRISTTPVATGLEWSPDGEQLAFVHFIQGECGRFGCDYAFDVHTVANDGSAEQELTSPEPPEPGTAQWSPDGQRMVFTTRNVLQEMNDDGTCESRLTAGVFGSAAWQPVPGRPPSELIECSDLGVRGESEPRIAAGATATFRFTVVNDGTEPATDAAVAASMEGPGEPVSITATQGSCSLGTVSCELGSVAPRAEVVVAVRVRSTVQPAADLAGLSLVASNIAVTVSAVAADDHRQSNNTAGVGTAAWECTKVATDLDDVVRGTPSRDVLCAFDGNDRVAGLGGRDVLTGGPGNDTLDGGAGQDEISGAGFDDRIDAGKGDDFVDGGYGNNRIIGGPGRDRLDGGRDHDRIEGGAGEDDLDGGGSNDRLTGGPGRDRIRAGYGFDVVLARDGERDRITCGGRFDIVYADRRDRTGQDCELVRRSRQ